MAFISDLQARIPTQVLKNLTNPNDTSSTSVDTTVLALAITDMENLFLVETGTDFDENNKTHTALGIIGTIVVLQRNIQKNTERVQQLYKEWTDILNKYRKKLGTAQRVTPATTSNLAPLREDFSGGRPAHAGFDNMLDHFILARPVGSQGSDNFNYSDNGINWEDDD